MRLQRTIRRWLRAVGLVVVGTMVAVTVGAVPASAATSWLAVSAGNRHTCGIKSDNTLWCWGANELGRLGIGTATGFEWAPVKVGSGYKAVSVGWAHTCALKTDGTAYCWGYNGTGQLGVNDTANRTKPTWVVDRAPFESITAGGSHTCAVRANGTGRCWGDNSSGQLGLGHTSQQLTPANIADNHKWRSLSAGTYHTCGVDQDYERYCWGSNASRELGLGADESGHLAPAQRPDDGHWQVVAAGINFFTCGLNYNWWLACWGDTGGYHLGNGSIQPELAPNVISTAAFIAVTAGGDQACAIAVAGTRYCWGNGLNGALGMGNWNNQPYPLTLGRETLRWKTIDAGFAHTCGITTTNALYCWGNNLYGQVGDKSWEDRNTPKLIN